MIATSMCHYAAFRHLNAVEPVARGNFAQQATLPGPPVVKLEALKRSNAAIAIRFSFISLAAYRITLIMDVPAIHC